MVSRWVLVLLSTLLAVAAGCASTSSEGAREPASEGAATSIPSPTTADDASPERRIAIALFDRLNAEREARGLEPLSWSPTLARYGRIWSRHLADTGPLVHRDLDRFVDKEGLSDLRAVGENLYRATGAVPAGSIHVGWMESDDHRHNVLQPAFDQVGIGVVCTGDGRVYATQEFGRTRGADRPDLTEETPPEQPIARPAENGPTC